jgi:hypothetical protein
MVVLSWCTRGSTRLRARFKSQRPASRLQRQRPETPRPRHNQLRSASQAYRHAHKEIETLESRARAAKALEAHAWEAEAAPRAIQECIDASKVRSREAEAAAKTARKQAEAVESARHHDSELHGTSMGKIDGLTKEVQSLGAWDVAQQEELTQAFRGKNSAEASARQLSVQVSLMES